MDKHQPVEHLEATNTEIEGEKQLGGIVTTDINDVKRNKQLNRRLDLRVLPLCCWIYLLNFLVSPLENTYPCSGA